jgi:hypothetical protein
MLRRLSSLTLTLALTLSPVVSHAATGDSLWPGDAETETVRNQRITRVEGLRLAVIKERKTDGELRAQYAAYLKERAVLRDDCRERLRRSNRDTRLPATIRCYKDDLTLERAYLGARRASLAALPAVSDDVRSTALSRMDLFTDALDTVLFALESGVYSTVEDLTEAKNNLLNRYRKPFWDTQVAVRADRASLVAGALIVKTDIARDAERKAKGTAREGWKDARLCLSLQESSLRTLATLQPLNRSGALAGIRSVQGCSEQLRALLPASGSGSTAAQ